MKSRLREGCKKVVFMLAARLPGDVKEVSVSGLFSPPHPPYLLINVYQTHYFLMKEKLQFSKSGSFGICVPHTRIPVAGGLQMVFVHRNGGVKGAVTPVCTSALACSA